MKCPAELYTASTRVYAGLPDLTYPFHEIYLADTHGVERAKGIEPSYAAWEAAVLPLNYARGRLFSFEHNIRANATVFVARENRHLLFRIYSAHN